MKPWTTKVTAMLGVVLAAASVFAVANGIVGRGQQASAQLNPALADESTITGIYAAASPAVVEIETSQGTGTRGFSMGGQGSGFVVDSSGTILTNNHVVDGATSVDVVFYDGSTQTGTVVGKDAVDDLAVVKVNSLPSGITPLVLVESNSVKPGQTAIAIGSPYGLTNSIAVGVVSGLNRRVSGSSLTGMIQTDANIQPGNSGGPLLNSLGQVIGINTAFEGQGTGIGFAVPSSIAIKALPDIKAGVQIQRAWLGISGLDLTPTNAQSIGLSVNQGVYVVTDVAGGPAEKAGLKASGSDQNGNPSKGGDIITAIDGKPVKSVTDIQTYLASRKVGDTVSLTVVRDSGNVTVSVTLGARPADTTSVTPSTPSDPSTPGTPGMPNFQWPWRNR